ncbi:MAG TPA: extracellular solute-binding protein [Dongiaceae bacterium]|nr:extracellular solute-binding protein [Dongiaceae bacterium]
MSKTIAATALSAALALGIATAAHAETTISALFMSQAAYSEQNVRDMTADFMKANPDIKVNVEFVPYEGLRDKTLLSQGAGGGYDVVLFDVIWPAEYAENKVLVDVTDRITPDMKSAIMPGAWTTVDYKDHAYGMPWILDTKYLFYNTEMLEKAGIAAPPKTWDELISQAKTIKEKGIVEYPIVWSWAQAEAVICDYTMLLASYGGSFLTDDGKPAFQSGGGVQALDYMVKSVEEGVTNPNSKEYVEEDVRRVFSSGQAAFALNWTYMYNSANTPGGETKIAGKVGVVPGPGVSGKLDASAVNGSMGLGITTASKHPDEAWKYVLAMTSPETQSKYAQLSLPIWSAWYDHPNVDKSQEPLIAAAKVGLAAMYPRPTTPKYQELSTAIQQAIQSALLKSATPEAALKDAAAASGL